MQIYRFIYLFLVSSACFGRCFRPSSGARDCIYSFWYCSPMLLPAGVMDEVELTEVSSISSMTPAGSNIGKKNTRSCKYSHVLLMMGEDIAPNM